MPKKTTRDPKPKNPRYPAAPPEQIVTPRSAGLRPGEPENPLAGVLLLNENENPEKSGSATEPQSTPSKAGNESVQNSSSSVPLWQNPPQSAIRNQQSAIQPHFSAPGLWLYHANCLAVLDAIHQKYPEGRFDCIFADPPYFLSNGGITCHAGKMVKVHKGDWDQSRGWEWNHEFNTEWLRRCQRVLKPNGTIWVTGTHHVIFSVGFALQQLGYKILNDIAWEKPNPPPNLSCRYFTHSTETIIWAAKNDKSKHVFNYQAMRQVTGKQMKTVWRKNEFPEELATEPQSTPSGERKESDQDSAPSVPLWQKSIWTMTAPGNAEKTHGKHPTQKPIALIERCLLASTNPGDLVLDPFLGGGTTAVVAIRLGRACIGIEMNSSHANLAAARAVHEIIQIWLRNFRVVFAISVSFAPTGGEGARRADEGAAGRERGSEFDIRQSKFEISKKDLDPSTRSMDRIKGMADDAPKADCIFHETKFVFLSCAVVSAASVVHTTVDVSLQEAWAKTPTGKKRETTHVVRCETEIFRIGTES